MYIETRFIEALRSQAFSLCFSFKTSQTGDTRYAQADDDGLITVNSSTRFLGDKLTPYGFF